MPRPISTSGIIAFLCVAEQGSINRAASSLNVSQPALTRTIKELETDLGNQLFERDAKGVSLTEFGRYLVGHAQRLRADIEILGRVSQSFKGERRITMSIGGVPVHPIGVIAAAIAELHHQEGVAVDFIVGSQTEMIGLLRAGTLEMVLGPLVAHKSSSDLLQEVINYETTELYCSPANPLARKKHIKPSHLGGAKWILGSRDTTLRYRIEHHFAQFGIALDVPLVIEDVSLRRSIVLQSGFVSAFQGNHVFNEVRDGTLVKLPYRVLDERQAIGCIRISEHTNLSRKLVELLKAQYSRKTGVKKHKPHPGPAPRRTPRQRSS